MDDKHRMIHPGGANFVDLRTTSRVGTIKGGGGSCPVPSIIAIKSCTAPRPIASRSCHIVVSGGSGYSPQTHSTKLATGKTAWTLRPPTFQDPRTPISHPPP